MLRINWSKSNKMTTTKKIFIKSLFTTLQSEEYILLKWLGEDITQLSDSSDLDILIAPVLEEKIANFIDNTTSIQKVKKTIRAGVSHYYLYFRNGDFLQIDLLLQFIRKDIAYLSVEDIFEHKIELNGIKTYDSNTLFEHVLLFNLLNKSGLPAKYNSYFNSLPQAEQLSILEKFNNKYGTNYQSFYSTTQYNKDNRTIILKYVNSLKENSFSKKVFNKVNYLKAIWRQMKDGSGQIITFSGVDGAGKSTIIKDVLYLLGGKYRKKVVVLRHRPSVLPIISAWKYGKLEAEQKSVASLPRQGKNKSKISSYLRFSYYYIDYLLGQFYIWVKYLLRGYTVLYDRYYFDFIIDGKRSNIDIAPSLPKFLYSFIAKPTLNFFLYADATTILKRKQELNAEVITTLTQSYQSLFQELAQRHSGKYLSIENIDKDATLQSILKQYIKVA